MNLVEGTYTKTETCKMIGEQVMVAIALVEKLKELHDAIHDLDHEKARMLCFTALDLKAELSRMSALPVIDPDGMYSSWSTTPYYTGN